MALVVSRFVEEVMKCPPFFCDAHMASLPAPKALGPDALKARQAILKLQIGEAKRQAPKKQQRKPRVHVEEPVDRKAAEAAKRQLKRSPQESALARRQVEKESNLFCALVEEFEEEEAGEVVVFPKAHSQPRRAKKQVHKKAQQPQQAVASPLRSKPQKFKPEPLPLAKKEDFGEERDCPVCLCPMEQPAQLKCGHEVCYECLSMLLDGVDWEGGKVILAQISCPSGCGARIQPKHGRKDQRGNRFPARARLNDLSKVADDCYKYAQGFLERERAQQVKAADLELEKARANGEGEAEGAQQKKRNQLDQPIKEGDVSEFLVKNVLLQCGECKDVLYGGKGECEAAGDNADQRGVKCPKCNFGSASECKIHGTEHMAYKCRFCCKPATFNCSGSSAGMPGPSHFCDPCHIHGYGAPTIPCDPRNCAFNGNHPPNPVEMPLGCILCRAEE